MSDEERKFLDALRKNSIEAAAEMLEGVQRLKSMYEEITDDGSGVRPPGPRLADHFYQLARFELEHAATLIRLGNSQAEMIFDHVRHLARRRQKTSAPVLTLEPGSTQAEGRIQAVGGFEIRSPFDATADLRFEVGPLKTADGGDAQGKVSVRGVGGKGTVRPRETARIALEAEIDETHRGETLFGELTVYLSAEIEKQVAHRVLKVRTVSTAKGDGP